MLAATASRRQEQCQDDKADAPAGYEVVPDPQEVAGPLAGAYGARRPARTTRARSAGPNAPSVSAPGAPARSRIPEAEALPRRRARSRRARRRSGPPARPTPRGSRIGRSGPAPRSFPGSGPPGREGSPRPCAPGRRAAVEAAGHHEVGLEGLVEAGLGDDHDGVYGGALGEALDQLSGALALCAGAAGRGQDQGAVPARPRSSSFIKLEQDAGRGRARGAPSPSRESRPAMTTIAWSDVPGRVRSTFRSSIILAVDGRLDRLLAEGARDDRTEALGDEVRAALSASLPGSRESPEREHVAGGLGRARSVELERARAEARPARAPPGARTRGRRAPRAQG